VRNAKGVSTKLPLTVGVNVHTTSGKNSTGKNLHFQPSKNRVAFFFDQKTLKQQAEKRDTLLKKPQEKTWETITS